MSARGRVALIVLGAALAPSAAFGAGSRAALRTVTTGHELTSTPRPVARAAQTQNGELSPTPPVKLSPGGGTSTTPAATPLPDTGADLPATALLGLGLLVSGIGLRLRTVDERIF